MMTLQDLTTPTTRSEPLLRPVPDTPQRPTAVVQQAVIIDPQWQLTNLTRPLHNGLALLPAAAATLTGQGAKEAMRDLMTRGVAALVVPFQAEACPHQIREAARAVELPLLAPEAPDVALGLLRGQIIELKAEVQEAHEEQTVHLRHLAGRLHADPHGAPNRIARWLEEALARERATVLSVPADEEVPALLVGDDTIARAFVQVREGQQPAASVPGSGIHVLLHPTSPDPPYLVLVVAMAYEPGPSVQELVVQAAQHISTASHRAAHEDVYRERMAVRLSVLQQLMVGETAAAIQVIHPSAPGALRGAEARMGVLECAKPEDRDAAVAAIEKVTNGKAVVGKCPAFHAHVLFSLSKAAASTDARARELLSPLTAGGAVLGLSTVMPLYATASAYGAARRALSTARSSPDRLTIHSGGTALAGQLSQPGLAAWAAAVRAPIATSRRVSPVMRAQMVHTTEIALAHGTTAAARMTACSVDTARRRMDAVMSAMGLDYGQLRDRAVAQLALSAPDPSPDSVEPVRPLVDLLGEEHPRAWAEELIEPLNGTPELIGLLMTWLKCNGEQLAVSALTGFGRNKVKSQLEAAAAALALPLTDSGGGGHEALWALFIRGTLGDTLMPDPAQPGSTHHHPPVGHREGHASPPAAGTSQAYNALGGEEASGSSLVDRILEVRPSAPVSAKTNRAFVLRSADWLAREAGVRQFLDIGAGVPTEGKAVHEIVQDVDPACRVVYVDHDPAVLISLRTLLRGGIPGVSFCEGDVRDPEGILRQPEVRALDWSKPVAILLNAVLHFVTDSDQREIVRQFIDPASSGSYLTLTHVTADYDPVSVAAVMEIYRDHGLSARHLSRTQVERLVAGLDLVSPGIVSLHRWRTREPVIETDAAVSGYGVVARKP